jgi:hypothetical protein
MSPRYDAKVDSNHGEIRDGLRALGVDVIDCHAVAQVVPGFPDLLAWSPASGWQLLEVKGPRGKLTDDEKAFHEQCAGPVRVVRTLERAAMIMDKEVDDGQGE